jgi:hypothetical protein
MCDSGNQCTRRKESAPAGHAGAGRVGIRGEHLFSQGWGILGSGRPGRWRAAWRGAGPNQRQRVSQRKRVPDILSLMTPFSDLSQSCAAVARMRRTMRHPVAFPRHPPHFRPRPPSRAARRDPPDAFAGALPRSHPPPRRRRPATCRNLKRPAHELQAAPAVPPYGLELRISPASRPKN